jgi:pimeloyl-ACP methyl ester carboxylesterase
MTRPTLMLVSGLASDEATWRPQLEALSAVIECRPVIPSGQTIGEMADAILERAPPRFAIAGHSLGGYVALAVQRRAAERVQGLALLNTSAAPDSERQRRNRLTLIAAIDEIGYETIIDRLMGVIGGANAAPVILAQIRAMMVRAGPDRFRRDQLAALDREDSRPALGSIAIPTLVVGSRGDRVVPPEASAEIASLIAAADLQIVDEVGHVSTLEAPSTIEAALLRWLDRVFGGVWREGTPSRPAS